MGRWAQSEYDRVALAKFRTLYDAIVDNPKSPSATDTRFRTFVRDLNPHDKEVQACFRTMIQQSHRSRVKRNSSSQTPSLATLLRPSRSRRSLGVVPWRSSDIYRADPLRDDVSDASTDSWHDDYEAPIPMAWRTRHARSRPNLGLDDVQTRTGAQNEGLPVAPAAAFDVESGTSRAASPSRAARRLRADPPSRGGAGPSRADAEADGDGRRASGTERERERAREDGLGDASMAWLSEYGPVGRSGMGVGVATGTGPVNAMGWSAVDGWDDDNDSLASESEAMMAETRALMRETRAMLRRQPHVPPGVSGDLDRLDRRMEAISRRVRRRDESGLDEEADRGGGGRAARRRIGTRRAPNGVGIEDDEDEDEDGAEDEAGLGEGVTMQRHGEGIVVAADDERDTRRDGLVFDALPLFQPGPLSPRTERQRSLGRLHHLMATVSAEANAGAGVGVGVGVGVGAGATADRPGAGAEQEREPSVDDPMFGFLNPDITRPARGPEEAYGPGAGPEGLDGGEAEVDVDGDAYGLGEDGQVDFVGIW